MTDNKELLSIVEAAELLGVSLPTFRMMRRVTVIKNLEVVVDSFN